MSRAPESWVPPEHVQRARRDRRRVEGLTGLAAGVLSFALVALWDEPLRGSHRFLVLGGIILALGASLAVGQAHLRASGHSRAGDALDPTARGLLGYARAIALAAILGACIYYILRFV